MKQYIKINKQINQDCRYFNSDRPCKFHKQEGVHCFDCKYYEQIKFKILIIKLASIGDVLRTTCILVGLKEKYPCSHITWLTQQESICLFDNNPYVDVVLIYSAKSFIQLQIEEYNLVINLDTSPESAQIASLCNGKEKLGFGYKNYVYPFNYEAQKWFEMGLFDDFKKVNKQTYQQIMLNICKLTTSNYEIIFNLSKEEKEFASNFSKRYKLWKSKIIGLNTGAGKRWKQKEWPKEKYLELIQLIQKKISNIQILLLGGPEETEKNNYLLTHSSNIINTGCNNTIHQFAALINLCELVVTSDTLAMHLAIALKKKVIVLFGPTSVNEIDLYGRGEKIFADIDCLCCYQNDCNKHPNCMELITSKMVLKSIKKLL